jgi:Nif-specific regulatory protein
MAYLIVREPGRVGFTFDLADECVVGRDAEAQLVVEDRLVSRRHLRIARGDAGFTVTDLASKHGTFVNGARVGEQALRDRDRVQAGNLILVFRDGPSPDPDAVYSATAAPESRVRDVDARLQLLFDVSRAIGALGDAGELLARLLDGAIEVLRADRGVVLLVGEGGRPRHQATRGARAEELVLGQKLRDAMLVRRESALVRAGSGQPPGMGAPLLAGGRALGFIYVARAAPFEPAELDWLTALAHLTAAALEQSDEKQRLKDVAEALRDALPQVELVGESEPMRRLADRVARFAAADAAVLIRGESGSGKELVARRLHALSPRAEQPFVAVNCAAIPDTLIESELFGHEKGAFTGALKRRRGKFELADRGTLFLDEVGDLSPAAQAKVLRAIEEGEVHPLGAERPIEVDVRVLSATHKPLDEEIAAGRFRSDLFYRLDVADLDVPPLRQRGDDVVLLAETFARRTAARGGHRFEGFAPGAKEILRRYTWPGNVRQLANEVERALLLGDGPLLDFEDLRARVEEAADDAASSSIAAAERRAVEKALEESGGNVVAAARTLGISRATLYRKIVKYKLE